MDPYSRNQLMDRLEREEGRRKFPYVDTMDKLTIGVGWNLSDNGLPDDIIDELLVRSVNSAQAFAEGIPGWHAANDARRTVLVAMAFQLGGSGVLKFRKFLAAFAAGMYEVAAAEMLNSQWHAQTPARCEREAAIMRSGVL